jgi:anti-anti-sigma factor
VMSDCDADIEPIPDVCEVTVTGEIDISNRDRFRDALTPQRDHRLLVVDLTRVTFIDSSGCAAIVAGVHRQRRSGGGLAIACRADNRRVRIVLETLGIDTVAPLYDTLDEARSAEPIPAPTVTDEL